jgi:hypothetical protein
MKTCVIYANCQGEIIDKVLQGFSPFSSVYSTVYIRNYRCMEEKTELPRDLLANADAVIYQPIDKKREVYCTSPDYPNGILSTLKSSCTRISFPYIYCSGFFIMYEEGSDIRNKDAILKLKEEGKSLEEILKMFMGGEINFNITERYKESLQIMREKELDCNVYAADLIESCTQNRRVFYTQNHVCNYVLFNVINQILKHLSLPEIQDFSRELEYMDRWRWPVSPYEIKQLGFQFMNTPDPGWVEVYSNLIKRAYCGDFSKNRDLYAVNLLQF